MKITYALVQEKFTGLGFTLLETKYVGAHTHMRYVCKCGSENSVTWSNFKKGGYNKRCCKYGHNLNIEFLKAFFIKEGCVLLEDVYVNARQSMHYQCSCGGLSKISWDNFKHGHRCRRCGTDKITGDKSHFWNSDREFVVLKERVRKKFYHMLRTTLIRTNQKKRCRSEKILGFSTGELLEHLENHPNWNTLKHTKWTIDHIFPIKAFLDYGITDPKIINCLDNLRPLSLTENLSKNGNYDKKEFEQWLASKNIFASYPLSAASAAKRHPLDTL